METFLVENPIPGKKIPKWVRTVFFDRAKDTIYVPGTMADFLCVTFDGGPMVAQGDHGYFPIKWFQREKPKERQSYIELETRIRKMIAKSDAMLAERGKR
jgi:hypothetical protein